LEINNLTKQLAGFYFVAKLFQPHHNKTVLLAVLEA